MFNKQDQKAEQAINECPVCGQKYTVKLRQAPYEGRYNKIAIRVEGVESYYCESCGEEMYTKGQSEQLDRQFKAAARKQLGVLSPARIVELRRRLNLSQDGLESLLGLGKKVVTRWETGRVIQGKATDDLLRLMERMPSVVDALREIRMETQQDGSPGR